MSSSVYVLIKLSNGRLIRLTSFPLTEAEAEEAYEMIDGIGIEQGMNTIHPDGSKSHRKSVDTFDGGFYYAGDMRATRAMTHYKDDRLG